jgi:molybdopterin-guanine dinucleotide biosynthesis protein MobB
VFSFVAPSGTGKTTYLERVLPHLAARGLRVLCVKHDVHGFEVDKPGKDSFRLRAAGAHAVLLANAEQIAWMGRADGDRPLSELIDRYGDGVDLVITEGYRKSGWPKVLVERAGVPGFSPSDLAAISPIVAVVTDLPRRRDVPEFPLGDAAACAAFLAAAVRSVPERRLTAVLLAGGRGQRMGGDKAFLRFRGELLLPVLVERLRAVCEGGVLVVRRPGQALPELPDGTPVLEDLLPGHGPLGGLLTGLAAAPTPWVFLAACDMPRLDAGLVTWLAGHGAANADVVLPIRDAHPEPAHAIYGWKCLAAIKGAVLSGELGMGTWLGSVRVDRVEEAAWRAADPEGRSMLNVNTPDDLLRAEAG